VVHACLKIRTAGDARNECEVDAICSKVGARSCSAGREGAHPIVQVEGFRRNITVKVEHQIVAFDYVVRVGVVADLCDRVVNDGADPTSGAPVPTPDCMVAPKPRSSSGFPFKSAHGLSAKLWSFSSTVFEGSSVAPVKTTCRSASSLMPRLGSASRKSTTSATAATRARSGQSPPTASAMATQRLPDVDVAIVICSGSSGQVTEEPAPDAQAAMRSRSVQPSASTPMCPGRTAKALAERVILGSNGLQAFAHVRA
jgi:hypothetical protein